MLKYKLISILAIYLFFAPQALGQGAEVVNKLPDYIPPTPEVAALFKAEQIGVGLTTGSPNIQIPLYTLDYAGFNLPISLSYSSTGIKVDEYASMVGLGWILQYGGVVSRTVLDKPDESRHPTNNNLTTPNPNVLNQAAYDFLNGAPDKECDIFNFSFPGFSGKFILDLNLLPSQLSNQHLKIQVINNNFLNGFIITDDKGTSYLFDEKEISVTRNPSGNNCEKAYESSNITTSWHLSKIILPSTRREINFSYLSTTQTFESSISQTLSKVLSTEMHPCFYTEGGSGPTGFACVVGEERFSTCVSRQTVNSRYISEIVTSEGDKISFYYHASPREDLDGGKRLTSISVKSRTGKSIRYVSFTNLYYSGVNGTGESVSTFQSKRLFLTGLEIRPSETSTTVERLRYDFEYYSPTQLSKRLSFAQDWYGYFNGKLSNPSLIPTLANNDVNYSVFNNGTESDLVEFGDRNMDSLYGIKGLLKKVRYPTRGYDILEYGANKTMKTTINGPIEILTGGFSVTKVKSFTDDGGLAGETRYYYRDLVDHKPTSFVLTSSLIFSQRTTNYKDGYICNGGPGTAPGLIYVGPSCEYAVLTSNSVIPIENMGGQHLYHKSALKVDFDGFSEQGITEYKYQYFGGGLIGPNHIMGNYNLNTPYQIVPELLIGEQESTIYKRDGSSLIPVKKVETTYDIHNQSEVTNYVVKKTYEYLASSSPPTAAMFEPFDVDRYYINFYTVRKVETAETEYAENGIQRSVVTETDYGSSTHNYPTLVKSIDSRNEEIKNEYKYPQDFVSGYSGLINRNIVGVPVEEKKTVGGIQQVLKNYTYQDWLSDGSIWGPSEISLKIQSFTQQQKVQFYSYDRYGNALELSEDNGERISLIWDYDSTYPIAKITNASYSQVAYTSFEADGKGNWYFGAAPVNDVTAPTGRRVYNNSTLLPVSKTGLNSSNTYILTYWTKNANAFTVLGTVSGYPKAGPVINGWRMFEHKITGRASIALSGNGLVDEVRLYPENASMVTQTYDPLIGMTSQADVNNTIVYFIYDGLGRLMLMLDAQRSILQKYCYHYSGNTESCTLYTNTEQSQNFTRSDCPTYYGGTSVNYTIPAGTYYSLTSVAHANAMAAEELSASGQAYANMAGQCFVQCNTPLCTGNDKKCVNGRCETGIKVVTSSVQLGPHLWECTYHYEWSDGSWSPNYTEQSISNCSMPEN